MSRRLSLIALFAAWLCASGAMLDVVQVFAWARMFTGYAQTMSVADAAAETMDQGKPCPICVAVRRAREHSRQQPPAAAHSEEKLVLLLDVVEAPLLVTRRESWPPAAGVRAVSCEVDVPVPPPRAAGENVLV